MAIACAASSSTGLPSSPDRRGHTELPCEARPAPQPPASIEPGLELPPLGPVILKPNVTLAEPPERRITTHPGFVAGVIDGLVEAGVEAARIQLVEALPADDASGSESLAASGYSEVMQSRGVSFSLTDWADATDVHVPGGVVHRRLPINSIVLRGSLFLNIPVAKCHNLCCTTLCIKNLMGIVKTPFRHFCQEQSVEKPFSDDLWRVTATGLSRFEDRFTNKLCDLLELLRNTGMARLSIVDGLVGRDGTGFNEGENRPLGWTLIGENEVHVDTVATYLMGLNPEMTPYLRVAANRGLGTNRVADIEVVDLATGMILADGSLAGLVAKMPFTPISPLPGGYYSRFRRDGSVVPWRLDHVNAQREADGLAPVEVETPPPELARFDS